MNLTRPLILGLGLALAGVAAAQQDPHAGHHPADTPAVSAAPTAPAAPADSASAARPAMPGMGPQGGMCVGMDMGGMKAMRDWQQRMRAARGASERKVLMAEHQKLLDEHQKMMDGCAGMMKDG